MDTTALSQLPAIIKTAFNHGFVFIVSKDLVQHFPAREWTDEQILENLFNRYQTKGTFKELENYRVVELAERKDLLIVVP